MSLTITYHHLTSSVTYPQVGYLLICFLCACNLQQCYLLLPTVGVTYRYLCWFTLLYVLPTTLLVLPAVTYHYILLPTCPLSTVTYHCLLFVTYLGDLSDFYHEFESGKKCFPQLICWYNKNFGKGYIQSCISKNLVL